MKLHATLGILVLCIVSSGLCDEVINPHDAVPTLFGRTLATTEVFDFRLHIFSQAELDQMKQDSVCAIVYFSLRDGRVTKALVTDKSTVKSILGHVVDPEAIMKKYQVRLVAKHAIYQTVRLPDGETQASINNAKIADFPVSSGDVVAICMSQ